MRLLLLTLFAAVLSTGNGVDDVCNCTDTDVYKVRKQTRSTDVEFVSSRQPTVTDFDGYTVYLRPDDFYSVVVYGRLFENDRATINITLDGITTRRYRTTASVFDFCVLMEPRVVARTALGLSCYLPFDIVMAVRKL